MAFSVNHPILYLFSGIVVAFILAQSGHNQKLVQEDGPDETLALVIQPFQVDE